MRDFGIIGALFISATKDFIKAGAAAISCVQNIIEYTEEKNKEKREMEEAEKIENQINTSLDRIGRKYGEPDRLILPKDKSEYGFFALFVKHELLCINDAEIKFSDIASYKLVDNYFIENGKVSGDIETSTDSDSLIDRSIGGYLLGVNTGAIIGGATASKSSSVNISQENNKLVHDYTLLVNMKGLTQEGIEIHIGNDWRLASELEHLFNQIIEYNLSK